MKRKSGFTLVEIIVSLAIIGIIAAAMIPVFALQLNMMANTKKLTTGVFAAQADVENAIYTLKEALTTPATTDEAAIPGVTEVKRTVFGREVTVYRLHSEFTDRPDKSFLVFLSQTLAQKELRTLLRADGVTIEVSGETEHELADLKKSPAPTLKGKYAPNTDPKWYVNLYRWYVSKEGDPDPVFPDDYTRIPMPGTVPDSLNNLSRYANRYIIFTVTPVDIHGIRGHEVRSNNAVYILGKEWRTGLFAWVDKDANTMFEDAADVRVEKSLAWPLNIGFDSSVPFPDPAEPARLLDPQNGSLYVPMSIDRAAGKTVGPILATGTQKIDWDVDKSIHLATDLQVLNSMDAVLNARGGSVVLYQYVAMNARGDAIFESDGRAKTINQGAKIITSYGSINLTTTGQGHIAMNPYTMLKSGANIYLAPFGNILMHGATLEARGSIGLDTAKGASVPGNRDILIQKSKLVLTGNQANQSITVQARNRLSVEESEIRGYYEKRGVLNLTAADGVHLLDTELAHMEVRLHSDTGISGGGWDADSVIAIPNTTTLTLGAGVGRINNEGSILAGQTGTIAFEGLMEGTLQYPLQLSLRKGVADTEVIVSNNYGRDLAYAEPGTSTIGVPDQGTYQNLGTGATNLEFTVQKISGEGDGRVACWYDGTEMIKLEAFGTGPISALYRLSVRDQYARDVRGTILFLLEAGEGEPPTLKVVGTEMPKRTITFNKNGGDTEANPQSITLEAGSPVGMLPTPPTRTGWWFMGWRTGPTGGDPITSATIVDQDMIAFAEWGRRLSFAELAVGDYVRINEIDFQVIGDEKLLARDRITNPVSWRSAQAAAGSFRSNHLSRVPWVVSSGLVEGDTLQELADGGYRNSILQRDYFWWGGAASGYGGNRAYRVSTNGTLSIGNASENRIYSARPCITVDDDDLYVLSGSGTAADPYVLGY